MRTNILCRKRHTKIKELNSTRVQQIANRIAIEASKNDRNEEGGKRIAGLGVNPDTVSKVVDENGEPLVVSKSRRAYILL